jgi:hypothetical protein
MIQKKLISCLHQHSFLVKFLHYWIGKKLGKVAKIFGDDRFEPKKQTLVNTSIFLGGEFSHNGYKKIWKEYGVFSFIL